MNRPAPGPTHESMTYEEQMIESSIRMYESVPDEHKYMAVAIARYYNNVHPDFFDEIAYNN